MSAPSTPPTTDLPELSVIVPTFGRAETIARLLERLDRQTLDPGRFEVVVVDDGSPEPIAIDTTRFRYRLELLRQDNAGPGAARNLALTRCRAPWTLILNDDAVPADDLLAKHLEAATTVDPKVAILGTFAFTRGALRGPFTQVLQQSDLLFDFPKLRHGELHGWTFFWTCNISLPTEALREIGGFDASTFREPIVEDVELGYRLAKRGWRVLHRGDLVCDHDHRLAPAGYFKRMVRLGVNMARMYEKHRDPALLYLAGEAQLGPAFFARLQQSVEAFYPSQQKLIEKLEALERDQDGQVLPSQLVHQLSTLIRQMGTVAYWRGLLLHFDGRDPEVVLREGPRAGGLTSIVVVSYNALDKTKKCVEALRAARDTSYPTELLFVDNGSSDGSAEWLAEQGDLTLIRNTENRGAPAARNQALALAKGDWIVVMDNDAIVTPGWLRRLMHHAQVDARSGCIGPVSDRAAHGQQVPFEGACDLAALERHATAWAEANARRSRLQNMLTSFCLLMRREVIDTIGGFDERFSPWGFEDDDFTLRAALAGFRNRIALDVFVRHEHYGGAKAERHNALLQQNWRQFTQKWAGKSNVAYGDYQALESGFRRKYRPDELRVALRPASEPHAALPETRPTTASRS